MSTRPATDKHAALKDRIRKAVLAATDSVCWKRFPGSNANPVVVIDEQRGIAIVTFAGTIPLEKAKELDA